jgi:uncharacterized protein YigA (DUF484 family)
MDFDDLDTERVEEWKENNPELFEEHKEALFELAVAAAADQIEYLAEKLDEITSDIRDEVNHLDKGLQEGGGQ